MTTAPDFSHMTNAPLRIGGVEANEFTVAFEGQSGYANGHAFDKNVDNPPAYPTPNMDTEEENEAEVFSCGMCNKPFLRPCDLNKHIKTHSRPYKCPDPQCEYHEVGWPTEKEADRHYNDKHAQAPQTFRCRFCTHTSKRQSNLKQHMEKAHGWNYIRSRSMKSYRCPMVGCSDCSSLEESQETHGGIGQVTPISAASQHHMGDFILFGDGMSPSTPVLSGDGLYVQMPHQGMADSYVPWASPPTRGEDISNCLRSVDSVISHPLLDPRLAQPPYSQATQGYRVLEGTVPQYLSPQQPVSNPAFKVSCSPPALALANPGWGEVPNNSMSKDGQSPSQAPTGRSGRNAGGSVAYSPSLAGPYQSTSAGFIHLKEEEEDDDENDDEEPPRKRPRTGSVDDFDDDQMPCPFWLLDPNFFNRNNKEKFSPCHTKHKDISTIVRHLSRPAHYLEVNERSVSSFDTPEEEKPSLKAGLCRKCWKIFRDRDEFDGHVNRACAKVSKGKREKFWLLYKAFCLDPDVVATESRRQSSAQDVGLGQPIDNDMELDPAIVAMPAANMPDHPAPEPMAQPAEDEDGPVSRSEHRALETKYKVLKRALRLILKHMVSGRDTEPTTHAFALHGTTGRMGSSLSALPDDLARHAEVEADARSEDARDRESLVSGMDSRPTDVIRDRDRFIFEAQRTLSGLSSCSDKSSVRHVPLTPRFDGSEERVATIKAAVATPLKTTGGTYADSGYGGSSTKDKGRGVKQSVSSTDLETVQEQREVETAFLGVSVGGDSQGVNSEFLQEMPEAGMTDIDYYWDN